MSLFNYFKSSESPSENMTRETIQAQSGKIRLSDTDLETGLDLFCYHKCDNNETDLVKNCRGVIYNGDKIVMRGFPYTDEYTCDNMSELRSALKKGIGEYRYFEAHEGALLRVFYWKEKWYITTHRKLDAFRSKWASKDSFGMLFRDALEYKRKQRNEEFMKQCYGDEWDKKDNVVDEKSDILNDFLTSLDTTKQYMFLILNNYDNRIVCVSPEEPTVYHVGTFSTTVVDDVQVPDTKCDLTTRVGLDWPRSYTFNSWEEINDVVMSQNSENSQGVIIYDPDSSTQFKLYNNEYYELFKVRGNEPSVKFRYLQVRNDKRLVDQLYYLYPKYADAFDNYENTLYECAKQINKNYIDRFIKKKYVTVPKEEFNIMKGCHDWHLMDREKNRISLRKVIDTMNEQSPSNLNRIIRRYRSEQVKDELSRQTKMTRLRARSLSHHSEEASLRNSGEFRQRTPQVHSSEHIESN